MAVAAVAQPFLENIDPAKGMFSPMRLVAGTKPEDIFFGELGYAREARASYLDFLDAKQRGDIAKDTRFMVALPTRYNATTVAWTTWNCRNGSQRTITSRRTKVGKLASLQIPNRSKTPPTAGFFAYFTLKY